MGKNRYLTSNIKLHIDSQGNYEATHRHQGTLYECEYFETRTEARHEAVKVLMDIKEDQE